MIIPILTFLIMACSSAPTQVPGQPLAAAVVHKASFSGLSPAEKNYYANAIESQYESLLVKRGFNGAILVAKNGEIVFEDYRGTYNFKTGEQLSENTPLHVASISKTFTAMVVLKLMEQGKLKLDDPVERYITNFPYSGITIRDLLSHRSGLPKYDHFMDGTQTIATTVRNRRGKLVKRYRTVKSPVQVTGMVSNEDVLNYMIRFRPPVEASPNRRYIYCNTNFAMLALVVERITKTPFPEYMMTNVFKPLGMDHTYIFTIKDTANYVPSYYANRNPFRLEKLDCVYGDKNVYTTVRDLLRWDKALYDGSFLSPETLELAYQPYSHELRGVKNYGLGWHLLVKPSEPTVVYHNGWWHGNNAVFKRLVADTATVIILGNKFNPGIWSAGKMSSVFTGRPDTTELDQNSGGE